LPAGAGGYNRAAIGLEGDFLKSNIDLADPIFFRSVILMITRDDTSALGEVIEGMYASYDAPVRGPG
jgi:putative AlgH/UPF0301 family transcriptional regulator